LEEVLVAKEDFVEAFRLEWAMRELYLKAADCDQETIAAHRREILHNYRLTEEEVEDEKT
jgi:hypothetical protein